MTDAALHSIETAAPRVYAPSVWRLVENGRNIFDRRRRVA